MKKIILIGVVAALIIFIIIIGIIKKNTNQKPGTLGYMIEYSTKYVQDNIVDAVHSIPEFADKEFTTIETMRFRSVSDQEYDVIVSGILSGEGKCNFEWKLFYDEDGNCKSYEKPVVTVVEGAGTND